MDWLHDYERLAHGPGFVALPDWRVLRLSGPDAKDFLHGLVTNDVKGLAAGAGAPCCILTPKGKLQADFLLYNIGPENLLLLGNALSIANAKSALAKMLPLSQSRLEEVSTPVFWRSGGFPRWKAAKDGDGWVFSDPRLREGAAYQLGATPPGAELDLKVWEALRVEAGVPLFGVDADAECLPLEAGLDAAVSFTKGCYMGQEVMSRVHHMGHVNRLLKILKLEGEAGPGPVTVEDKEIGRVTTVSWSPRHGATLALALIRSEAAAPGTRLDVGSEAAPVSAVVL